MSRALRIEYPGAWYHVMNRGINKQQVFRTDSHRLRFFELLSEIHHRYGVEIHAYCLMDNHYHLLIHTPKGKLGEAMRHLNSLYTRSFNRAEQRDGSLFRGRYKAILIEAEHYALELSRYIHMNPVAAKICKRPEDYKWSSYSVYMRRVKKPEWLYCEEILSRCSSSSSLKYYQEFVMDKIDIEVAEIFTANHYPSALGHEDWIKQIRERHLQVLIDNEVYVSEELVESVEKTDINILTQQILDYYKITLKKSKKGDISLVENKVRNWFVYLAVEYGGYAHKEIAEALGGMSISGVSQIKRRLHNKIKENHSFQKELEKLKEACGFKCQVSRLDTSTNLK